MASREFELEVVDRIQLLNLLPREGNLVTMQVVADLRTDISFSDQEIEDWKIKTNFETEMIKWEDSKTKVKKIKIGATGMKIIRDAVARLDETNKITESSLALINKMGL